MSKKKQIEEMAFDMCGNGMSKKYCATDDEPCNLECVYGCCAERLYNAGYRKQEWISVEERLPGVSGRYICAVKDKNGHTWTVAADYSLEMKAWFGLMFGEIKNTVTHWMPLPDAPKGE